MNEHPTNRRLIIPGANGTPAADVPDEMADAMTPPDALIPLMFVQPVAGLPTGIDVDVFRDADDTAWVVMRIETVMGSTVVFLHPDVADNLVGQLDRKQSEARPGD